MSWLLWVTLTVPQPSEASLRLLDSGHREAAAGRWDAAYRYYDQARRTTPGWADPLAGLGRSVLHQGDLDEAAAWYDALAALEAPVLARTGQALGECVRREGSGAVPAGTCVRYAAARESGAEALQQVLVEAPSLAPAWADLGALLQDSGLREEAIGRGLEADPESGTFGVLVVQQQVLLLGAETSYQRAPSRVTR